MLLDACFKGHITDRQSDVTVNLCVQFSLLSFVFTLFSLFGALHIAAVLAWMEVMDKHCSATL